LIIEKRLETSVPTHSAAQLTLSYEARQKSRQRLNLDNGEEIGFFLPRGTVLKDGDLLEADNGLLIEIKAAEEKLSSAFTTDPLLLLRACYHLGNRHIPIEISESRVSYLHDHVIDDMLRQLGLEIVTYIGPFEPESGAYHSHSHQHG
jgi:urease accessory protein